jgi:anti-sigma-K factor RskA
MRPFLGQNTRIMKCSSLLIAVILTLACGGLFAQGRIDLQASDTILGVLQKNTGQTVELRMKSGEKIGGKVEKIGDKLVHLSQLAGAEFFDAAINTDDVAAVIVRTKSK